MTLAPVGNVKELVNTKKVQKAEVTLPLDAFKMFTSSEYLDALKIVQLVRDSALAVLDVEDDNADVTAVEYAMVGDTAVVTVTQVDT